MSGWVVFEGRYTPDSLDAMISSDLSTTPQPTNYRKLNKILTKIKFIGVSGNCVTDGATRSEIMNGIRDTV
eukprot:917792-Amorphochlora_amoeboformis.AAC.1